MNPQDAIDRSFLQSVKSITQDINYLRDLHAEFKALNKSLVAIEMALVDHREDAKINHKILIDALENIAQAIYTV